VFGGRQRIRLIANVVDENTPVVNDMNQTECLAVVAMNTDVFDNCSTVQSASL